MAICRLLFNFRITIDVSEAMVEFRTLNMPGYRNEQVPNTFFRQERETRRLAVIFPGLGYNAHMPLMYYSSRLLGIMGADVLRVEYTYSRRSEYRSLPEEEQDRWLYADASAALKAGLAQRSYKQITLVGKSIGTLAIGHLLGSRLSVIKPQVVWLTPLLRIDRLRQQIIQSPHRALFIIGNADPHYDAVRLAEVVQAIDGESMVIEGGDHSLEIKEDLLGSLDAMRRIMQRIGEFVAK